MQYVVAFRGTHTAAILADSGQVMDGAAILVVCREGDRLAAVGDMTVAEAVAALTQMPNGDSVILLANGGTTAQVVPVLACLCRGWDGCHAAVRVLDVQRDGVAVLFEREALDDLLDKPACRLTGRDVIQLQG